MAYQNENDRYYDLMAKLEDYHRVKLEISECQNTSELYDNIRNGIKIDLEVIKGVIKEVKTPNCYNNEKEYLSEQKKQEVLLEQKIQEILRKIDLLSFYNENKDDHLKKIVNYLSTEMIKLTNLSYKKGVYAFFMNKNKDEKYPDIFSNIPFEEISYIIEQYGNNGSGGGSSNNNNSNTNNNDNNVNSNNNTFLYIDINGNKDVIPIDYQNTTILPLNKRNEDSKLKLDAYL